MGELQDLWPRGEAALQTSPKPGIDGRMENSGEAGPIMSSTWSRSISSLFPPFTARALRPRRARPPSPANAPLQRDRTYGRMDGAAECLDQRRSAGDGNPASDRAHFQTASI